MPLFGKTNILNMARFLLSIMVFVQILKSFNKLNNLFNNKIFENKQLKKFGIVLQNTSQVTDCVSYIISGSCVHIFIHKLLYCI